MVKMKKIAIASDSNSGISPREAAALGVAILPMPFFVGGELYYEGVSLSREDFFRRQDAGEEISTSQPTPGDLLALWDRLLADHEELVYIPMSAGLSSSCETAEILARDYAGRVHVADNRRISVTQRQSVLDALALAKQGLSGAEIAAALERDRLEASIYLSVDTLRYLRRGGRITAAAAALGTVLSIKPVLQIQGGKLDAYAKVRGHRAARQAMLDALARDLSGRFRDRRPIVLAAHTCSDREAEGWLAEIRAAFPGYETYCAPLSLSIACHVGRGALGIGCVMPSAG